MNSRAVTGVAPGRVNLIGEHLDYNGGRCLPIAIPLHTQARVSVSRSRESRFESTHEEVGWQRYPAGMLAALEVDVPLEIAVASTIPTGSGLSSSAALLCSVAVGVNDLLGLNLDQAALARAAIRAETEFVGAPTGGMDQTAIIHAIAGCALEINFGNGELSQHQLDLDRMGLVLQVIDTRIRHTNLSGDYGDRRLECERASAELGLDHLVLAEDDHQGLSPVLARRTRHVATEQQRVSDFLEALGACDGVRLGEILSASHVSLRDDFEVSCPELDLAVSAAMGAGALGARMTGGGFGGCAIALTPVSRRDLVEQAVLSAFASRKWARPSVFRVAPVGGAHVVTDD